MSKIKRVIAMLLAVILLVGAAPLGGLAELEWPEWHLPKLSTLFATFAHAADPTSGTCGDNLTWNYNTSTKTLTISGTGSMKSYASEDAPWQPYRAVMKTVSIGSGVTSIGRDAFLGCTGLTRVSIPNSVTSIGSSAFHGCTGLTSVTIGKGVKSIDTWAFYGCTGLTSVAIPNSVTSIGSSAFHGCTGLTNITIPDSVTSIGSTAFSDTGYYNENANWDAGVLYLGHHLINAKRILSGAYSIRKNTVSIAGSAFYGCTGLTSVTIGNGVKSIGDHAFNGCTGLTSVTIPDSVTSIGEYAFRGTGLTSVTIPSSVTNIGEGVLNGCAGLMTITVAAGNRFYQSRGNCLIETASKILINGCNTSVIPSDGSVTNIGYGAFSYRKGLTSITIPNSVTGISNEAFIYCTGLTSITIPNSVTSISLGEGEVYGAFAFCTSLKSVSLSNKITSIPWRAFYGCTSLTSITIPSSVTTIDEVAFSGCTSLTSITIPNKVTSIGNYAFYGCTSLTSITIPNSVTSIGSGAFGGCSSLTNITIPNSVTSIGGSAFSRCTGLTSVTIGKGVKSIEMWAFYGCTGLTDISIPNSVTSIGEGAFLNCSELKGVAIGNGVKTINNTAFDSCTKLKDVYYAGSESKWKSISIGSGNNPLHYATIHYQHKQVHTISDYGVKNFAYQAAFLSFAGTPLDGVNSKKDLCFPGIQEHMIPQGMAYYPQKNWVLIASYDKTGTNCSVIYALNFSTGKLVAQFNLYKSDGTISKTHGGGIAVSSNYLYITDGKKVQYVPLSALNVSSGSSTILKYSGSVDIGTAEFSCGDTVANIAYLDYSCGTLWAGNFYSTIGQVWEKSWGYKATEKNNSLIVGYNLSGLSADAEIKQLKEFVTGKKPTYTIDIPNQIEAIQGATFIEGALILSRTPAASAPLGNSVYFFGDNITVIPHTLKNGTNKLTLDACFKSSNLPGGQNIFVKDGKIYCDYESEALAEAGENLWKATAHTDCIWEIDLVKLLNHTQPTFVYCPVDVDVYNKKTGNLIASIKNNTVEPISDPEIAIIAETIGDEKVIYLPGEGEYNIVVSGRDTGTVSCSVRENEFSEKLKESSRANFFDLDVTKTTVLTATMTGESFQADKFTLNKDGTGTVRPNETFKNAEKKVTITATAQGNGVAEGGATYVSGDYVILEAFADKGKIFCGWYENGTLISTESVFGFVARSDRTLKAVFREQPTIKIKNFTATKSVDYKATVTFTAVIENTLDGATIQWFVNDKKAETGETCTVKQATADYTVQCKLIGSNGSVLAESETETVKVSTGFFAKLVAFFRSLFGSLPVITQTIKETL